MFGQFRGSIIRLIEKVLLARDKNWKRKFIRSDILSTFRFRLLLELISVYQLLHLYKYFSKIYDRMRKKKKFEMLRDFHLDGCNDTCQGRFIRISTKFQVQCSCGIDTNGIQNDFLLSSLADEHTCTDRNSCRIRYLQLAGPSGWTVRQHILYEYPGYVLWFAGAAIVQIDLERRIWNEEILNRWF